MPTTLQIYHAYGNANGIREGFFLPPEQIDTQEDGIKAWHARAVNRAYEIIADVTETHDPLYYGDDSLTQEKHARPLHELLLSEFPDSSLVVQPSRCRDGFFHFLRLIRFPTQAPSITQLSEKIVASAIPIYPDSNLRFHTPWRSHDYRSPLEPLTSDRIPTVLARALKQT